MKLHRAILILLCIGAALRLQAQIDIEEVSTDTVDLFSKPQLASGKISPVPVVSTLLIPGSAHRSIGRPKSALGYISLDAVALFSAIYFSRYAARTIGNARSFAAQYAGAPAGVKEDYFWQMVGAFDTYSDFHETMGLIRDSDNRFVDEAYFWKWDDKAYREEYVEMQKNAKQYITISSFCIGAMILNRIVAFIDMRTSLKNNRYNNNAAISITPYISEGSANGLMVRSDF